MFRVHQIQVAPGLVVILFCNVQPEVLNALEKLFIFSTVEPLVNQATHPQTGIALGPKLLSC